MGVEQLMWDNVTLELERAQPLIVKSKGLLQERPTKKSSVFHSTHFLASGVL